MVHVPDWRGLGYGALLAKSLGLGFGATHFVVMGHAPSLWAAEGSRQLVSTERELGWVFMERRCMEMADTAICVSAHLLRWMREAGYAMPERSFVWPNVFPVPDPSPEAAAGRASRDGARLEEVVFFGRLEQRKGLVLFIDAIDRLARRGRAPARVTFLGGVSPRIDGPGLIREAAERWPAEVRAITGHGSAEAVAYLSQPGRLAVIPLAAGELLHRGDGVPARRNPLRGRGHGGTPELVAAQDHGRALVEPDHVALGERIAALAEAPLRAVRPRWEFEPSLAVWRRWHGQEAPFKASAAQFEARMRHAGAETPLVTVCIVHHERPELVRMAVDSVYAQDYPALEAVLVDDGSEGEAALAALDVIEGEFAERGWPVVRQENRFPGVARNAAAARARGEWLLFLDDDNVLFPDAVTRLVRAARFSGADCVPAASVRFFGEGDPRADPDSHGAPIRFLGAAEAWCRFANVAGDACALVRRAAHASAGGFVEAYRVGLEDLEFHNRLLAAGLRVEPMPDPVFYYRFGRTTRKRRNRSAEAAQLQVVAPHLAGRTAEERAYAAYATARICDTAGPGTPPSAPGAPPPATPANGCVVALSRRPGRAGVGRLEAGVLLDPAWLERAGRRAGEAGPLLELRRNGRLLARTRAREFHESVPMATGTGLARLAGALYSVHDAEDGALLAALAAPGWWRGRQRASGVENRDRPQVRGWLLDPAEPGRPCRAAIHVGGRLQAVVTAGERRDDIARWKGTGGHHGFAWTVPEAAAAEGTRIDVFDADTGRALSGSPLRVREGGVVASRRR